MAVTCRQLLAQRCNLQKESLKNPEAERVSYVMLEQYARHVTDFEQEQVVPNQSLIDRDQTDLTAF